MDVFKSEEQNDLCPSLTFKQRIIAFFSTLCLGVLFGVLAWVAIFQKNYTQFGVFFTLSNVTAIGGSMFLAGPLKQFKKMFEETRWIATCVYLLMMIFTLVAAFAIKSPALVIICCLMQYLAMIWYGLSYIPYARTVVKNCVKGVVG
jgi:flagellar biosynthesis protein FlhB